MCLCCMLLVDVISSVFVVVCVIVVSVLVVCVLLLLSLSLLCCAHTRSCSKVHRDGFSRCCYQAKCNKLIDSETRIHTNIQAKFLVFCCIFYFLFCSRSRGEHDIMLISRVYEFEVNDRRSVSSLINTECYTCTIVV